MKALYFEKTGSLEELKLRELPIPVAGPGEALVRIAAAAINPSDPKNVLGKMAETKLPRVPGRDFSGTVIEGPSQWKGVEVLGTGGGLGFSQNGTHAEFAVIPVDGLVRKPQSLSFPQAAALGLSYLTAWSAIVEAGEVSNKDSVLITGGVGAVGSSAIKIARHLGAKRITGTLRNEEERSRSREIPADSWVVIEGDAVPEGSFDLILDVVGGKIFSSLNRALAHKGRHVVIATQAPEVSFDLLDFYHREAHLIGVDTLKLSSRESAEILKKLVPLVETGVLTSPAVEVIGIEQAIDAYHAILEGRAKKKIVINLL